MPRTVINPPLAMPDPSGSIDAGWWHDTDREERIVCDLCPRECSLKPGDRGFCFVRQNTAGQLRLTTYGRSTGFCIDPIEKKPLNHFYPGTSVLSFGTAGCNLGCQFCQNWDISKSREVERLSELAMPDTIAAAAGKLGCRSVAFTYNDPIVWAEYAMDTAAECRRAGIKSVAVTAGYISPAARPAFFHAMDAANVDLKAFTEDFYHRITYSHLQPVLDTLKWLKHESDVWFEITNLVIPGANDSEDELKQMCDWILNSIGPDVPVHFSAFHPDFRMTDRGRTPHETLLKAWETARAVGLKYVFVGNVNDVPHQSTWCPGCRGLLIERNWYQLGQYNLRGNQCVACGTKIAGHFDDRPGTWGPRRQPVKISDYASGNGRSPETRATSVLTSKTISAEGTTPHRSPVNALPVEIAGDTNTVRMPSSSGTLTTMLTVQRKPSLTLEQETTIHRAACEIVLCAVRRVRVRVSDVDLCGSAGTVVMGAFVTLKRAGQLRGCCGTLGQPMRLSDALTQAATRTATEDPRFLPVSLSELSDLTLDVTLLFNFETMPSAAGDRLASVVVGQHGLRIQLGNRAGLLLPGVAVEHRWDAGTFLEQVCRKAGLALNAWQDPSALLQRFEGHMIQGHFDRSLLIDSADVRLLPYSGEQITALARFVRNNLLALVQGAVPGCFPSELPDGTVDGIALQMSTETGTIATLTQIRFRGGLPLQSSLLNLTQSAADWLRARKAGPEFCRALNVDLALFADPAIHGLVQTADIPGFDPQKRAIVVASDRESFWAFDPDSTAAELLKKVRDNAGFTNRSDVTAGSFLVLCSTSAMSGSCQSTLPKDGQPNRVSTAEKESFQNSRSVRPAAVAGTFYPADAAALSRVVDECLGEIPDQKEAWPAVMVPHAGLVYSGRIAAEVLRRIQIPETVLIIGPRHTSEGASWAIAPNDVWQIPGATLASDQALVQLLADRIDGLQLDAVAHSREHSIEVELPFLAKLSPHSKVAGIAVGAAEYEQCRRFGQQLASVIAGLQTRPLLVISSDMNHFASEAKNRELDELALAAMETLDPEVLFRTVRAHKISMCGVVPAVIVMEALKSLGQLSRVVRAGYSTSADVSGDRSRVVGYAGMLLGDSPVLCTGAR